MTLRLGFHRGNLSLVNSSEHLRRIKSDAQELNTYSFALLLRLNQSTTRQSRVSSGASTPQAGRAPSKHSLTASPTNFSTASRIGSGLRTGAKGYLAKSELPENLLKAIREVLRTDAKQAHTVLDTLGRFFD